MRWLSGALKEPDRVVLRLVPEKAVAWHYGKGTTHDKEEGVAPGNPAHLFPRCERLTTSTRAS